MAKWIYRKCNVITHVTDEIVEYAIVKGTRMAIPRYGLITIIRNGVFIEIRMAEITVGDFVRVDETQLDPNTLTGAVISTSPIVDGSVIAKITTAQTSSDDYARIETQIYQYKDVYNYEEGSFIEEITAEEGALPNNGRHTDGYWYVKTKKAISSQIKIDGVVRDIVGYELKGYGAVSLQFKDDKGIIHDI